MTANRAKPNKCERAIVVYMTRPSKAFARLKQARLDVFGLRNAVKTTNAP